MEFFKLDRASAQDATASGNFSGQVWMQRMITEQQASDVELLAVYFDKEYNVPCGHPHTSAQNLDWVLAEGFRWLMVSREISFKGLEAGRKATGRA